MFLLSILLLLYSSNSSFLTHFVYYGDYLCCYNLSRIIKYKYPYLIHVNRQLKEIQNFKLERNLSILQKSYIKRMKVLQLYGGLYLDTDQFVNISCVQNQLVNKYGQKELEFKNSKIYVLDSEKTQYLSQRQQQLRLSIIYAPSANSPLLNQILKNYNFSKQDASNSTGPQYVQKISNNMNSGSELIKIRLPSKCQLHLDMEKWDQNNSLPKWTTTYWREITFFQKKPEFQQYALQQTFFRQLFKTHSIIYPQQYFKKLKQREKMEKQKQHNQSQQIDVIKTQRIGILQSEKYADLNHVEILNRAKRIYRVLKYSSNQQSKKLLKNFTETYPPSMNPLQTDESGTGNEENVEDIKKEADNNQNRYQCFECDEQKDYEKNQEKNIRQNRQNHLFISQNTEIAVVSVLFLIFLYLTFFGADISHLISFINTFVNSKKLNKYFKINKNYGYVEIRQHQQHKQRKQPINTMQDLKREVEKQHINDKGEQQKQKQQNKKTKIKKTNNQKYSFIFSLFNQKLSKANVAKKLAKIAVKISPFLLIICIVLLFTLTINKLHNKKKETSIQIDYVSNLNEQSFKDEKYKHIYKDPRQNGKVYQFQQIIIKLQQQQKNKSKQIKQLEQKKLKQEFIKKYGVRLYQNEQQPLIRSITNSGKNVQLKQLHLNKDINVGSSFDYLSLNKRKQFYQLRTQYLDNIRYNIYSFKYDPNLESEVSLITYQQLQKNQQLKQIMLKISQSNFTDKDHFDKSILLFLASNLHYNYSSMAIRQLQYYYYNKYFNLENITEQLPMCIFSTGYQIYTQNKYKRFLQSVQRQNYSNYQLVIIDDKSPDQSAMRYHQYLSHTNYKLKNRIKIIKNIDKLGALGNMYTYVKKICKKQSIVLNVDSDDSLVGFQTLNIINSIYQDPNVWYVYTSYFSHPNLKLGPQLGLYSVPLTVNTSQYRTANQWNTSHMRTYRQLLMDRVPIQQFIQYNLDKQNNLLIPRFYQTCADRFQIYIQIQLAGDERVKHVNIPLYYYDTSGTRKFCHYQYEHYVQYISRTKSKIKKLQRRDSDIQYQPHVTYADKFMQQFIKRAKIYHNCLKVFHVPQYLN